MLVHTVDRSAVRLRNSIQRQITISGNLESPVTLTCISVDGGRKQEEGENSHRYRKDIPCLSLEAQLLPFESRESGLANESQKCQRPLPVVASKMLRSVQHPPLPGPVDGIEYN
ncbi:unnamed protein product [Pleuronectes platessa]|uniref:Uncharacterized protein n=1 Tax=Pleuronectes platessa TaxID=8262 RepID=A0A9N7V4U8_PLEPL|nr:unnamed protein product [Pleuronectes platessa]